MYELKYTALITVLTVTKTCRLRTRKFNPEDNKGVSINIDKYCEL